MEKEKKFTQLYHCLPEVAKKKGWSQAEIARVTEQGTPDVNKWFRRSSPLPIKHLQTIADYFEVDIRELIKATNPNTELVYFDKGHKKQGIDTNGRAWLRQDHRNVNL